MRPGSICVPVGTPPTLSWAPGGDVKTSVSVRSLERGSGEGERDRDGERTGDAEREFENNTPDRTSSSRFCNKLAH